MAPARPTPNWKSPQAARSCSALARRTTRNEPAQGGPDRDRPDAAMAVLVDVADTGSLGMELVGEDHLAERRRSGRRPGSDDHGEGPEPGPEQSNTHGISPDIGR